MGYAREKEKVERKLKRIRLILVLVLALLVSGLCVLMSVSSPTSWKYKVFLPRIDEKGVDEIRVHFIDVGQGDATLVEFPDGKVMLIDGGNGGRKANKALLRHLNALELERIDYLVLTHADQDHFGGLTELLEHKRVERTFLPITSLEEEKDASYAEFLMVLDEENCLIETANVSLSKELSSGKEYTLAFLYPYTAISDGVVEPTYGNGASVVVWIEYKGVSFLLTGDAPVETELRLIRSQEEGLHELYGVDIRKTSVLKVSHHGSGEATSEEFLAYIGVEKAIISCGEENAYGHPDESVCERLRAVGAEIYRTDKQGSIIVTVENSGLYRVEKCGK